MSYAKHLTDKVTGLDKVQLRTDGGATADVYLHGAHVTSFKPSGGQEVIFVSKQAVYKPPKAIRGGIPVCWPQFNDMGPGTSHGFARNSAFEVACLSGSKVELRLSSNQDTKERFPHDFELRVTVEVTDAKGGTLHQTMEVDNKSADKMRTTHALHTYYRVSDIDNVSVSHLGSTEYLDNADERKAKSHAEAAARIDGVSLVDRIYKTQGRSVRIEDTGSPGRRIVVESEGFDDIVLWNPGPDAAKAMADLGDDEFRSMVCVEPANAALYMDGRAIEVAAGETWCASQQIHVEAL